MIKKLQFLLFFFPSFLFSQSDRSSVETDLILIQTIRLSEIAPITTTEIQRLELQKQNFGQEPSLILSQTPNITAHSDAGGYSGYSYFRLRGIDQTRINMTLNGVPLNEPEDQGVYFSNYPDFFNALQSLQIQRGVGTSANGTASYAGSLNFESYNINNPKELSFYAGYGSFGAYRLYGKYNTGLKNKKGLYVQASQVHSNGYKNHSGNTSQSAFASGGYLGEKNIVKWLAFVGNQKNDLAWIGVPMDSIRKNPRTNANTEVEKDRFSQAHAQVHYTRNLGTNIFLTNSLYYNYLKGYYDFDLNNFLGFKSDSNVYKYAFRSHFVGGMSNLHWQKGIFILNTGIHANSYRRQHTGSETQLGQLYQNEGFKSEASAYAKFQVIANKFVLLYDGQLRGVNFHYQGDAQMPVQNWLFLNQRLGATYRLSFKNNLYLNIGNTGREATRNDMFLGNDNLSKDSLGNIVFQAIKPESVYDIEAGFRGDYRFAKVHLNAYFMSFNNEIVLNGKYGPTGLPLHSNAAKSTRAGFEWELSKEWKDGFTLRHNGAYSLNQIKENDLTFQHILSPSLLLNTSLSYRINGFSASIAHKFQGKSYIDYANTQSLPAFSTINLNFAYQFKKWEFITYLNNVTNVQFFTNGYMDYANNPLYFVQAPRNFVAAIRWNL